MKQLIFLFLAVAAFIIAVGYYSKTPLPQNTVSFGNQNLSKREVVIGEVKVSTDVADSDAERKKGLGERDSLGENDGMLFIFPEKSSNVVFWMKDMKFAIDIIWISDNKIVKIDKNVQPEPGVAEDKLKRYYPETPINFVLEVNAGFSDKNKITLGNEVQIPQAP